MPAGSERATAGRAGSNDVGGGSVLLGAGARGVGPGASLISFS